jgi:hypothetical protein
MPPTPTSKSQKQRTTLYIETELVDEARGALVSLGFDGRGPASLSEMFNGALRREIVRLRRQFNEGEPFAPYRRGLPGGRPRKT